MKKYILMLLLSAMAMVSQAVLYKYEGFDYGAGTALRYQPGYSVSGSGGMPTNRAGSLAYAGLPDSTGGKVQLAGQSPAGTVRYVMWTTGVPNGANVTNLFASFILNVVNVGTIQGGGGFIFSVRNSNAQIMITNNAVNPSNYNVGIFQQAGKKVYTWDTNGGNGYNTNTPYLIVTAFTNSSPDATNINAAVWINPVLNPVPPAAATIQQTQLSQWSYTNYFELGTGNWNSSPGTEIYLDELRVGSTWGDVVANVSETVIVSLKPFAGNVMELAVKTADPSAAYPKATASLVDGSFESVAHSSNGVAPFVVTNLSYSTAVGSNVVIYVDATASTRFFAMGEMSSSTPSPPPTNDTPVSSLNDTLVWADEFDGTSIDAGKWDVIDGAALYTKIYMRAQNSTVSDGKLNLTYNKEDFGGASYSGARVQTKDKFPFLYGKVEIRAKVANTPGTWDAFWLLAQENSFWNEIDGFEIHGNNRNVVPMNYHWGTLATHRDKATFFSDGTTWANDYHIYTIDWTPTNLTWYIDGVVRKTETANVCNRPMFIILDTEMNTNELSVSSSFPQVFSIDYVKVYQSSNPCTVTVDKLDNYSKVYSRSSNLELKTDNPNYYVQGGQPKSDGSRVGLTSDAQSTQEYLIYNVPGLKDFAVNYYYSGAYSTAYNPKFYTSPNSTGPWTEFSAASVANEMSIAPRWEMRGINGFGVPAGTSFLKIEFPALGASYGNVQLGEVILVSQ